MVQLDLFAQDFIETAVQQKAVVKPKVKEPVNIKENSQKLYYPIREVANFYNVNASLLRFWETEFPQLKPRKTGRGDRLYNKENIELIGTIYYLTKEKKFTLEGTRAYLKNSAKAANHESELVKQLQDLKKFLQEIKVALQ